MLAVAATMAARRASRGRLIAITNDNTPNRMACHQSSTAPGQSHGSRRNGRDRSLSVLTSSVMSNGYQAAMTIAAATAAST